MGKKTKINTQEKGGTERKELSLFLKCNDKVFAKYAKPRKHQDMSVRFNTAYFLLPRATKNGEFCSFEGGCGYI